MNNGLIVDKKRARIARGVCMNCGFRPCYCAIPKGFARRVQLPAGLRRFKKRPKGVLPK